MSHHEYRTESLDLAAWMLAHDVELLDCRAITLRRSEFIFEDSQQHCHQKAIEFGNSLVTKTLESRKRLITISKSGRSGAQKKKEG